MTEKVPAKDEEAVVGTSFAGSYPFYSKCGGTEMFVKEPSVGGSVVRGTFGLVVLLPRTDRRRNDHSSDRGVDDV